MKTNYTTILPLSFVFASIILLIPVASKYFYGIDVILFTRDVTALGHIPSYYGMISTLGIIFWTVTVAVTFFSSMLLFTLNQRTCGRFLLFASLLTTYLLLDDAFLIHESSESWLKGGEKSIEILLGLAVIVYIYYFREVVLQSRFFTFLLALLFFFLSIAIDGLQPFLWKKTNIHALFEDGTKWFGIVFWCSYFVQTSYKMILKKFKTSPCDEN